MRSLTTVAAVGLSLAVGTAPTGDRVTVLSKAQVWLPIETRHVDIARGPRDVSGFGVNETVPCRYDPRTLPGHSPKFACIIGGADSVKVKYGGSNGEVFAEVAATRLLWALGFGADRLFPTRILCTGCPRGMPGIERASGQLIVTPAVIERKSGSGS